MGFTDRREAGRRLAERLLAMKEKDPVVLALPRGGVPVAFEIAVALAAPLDLVLVRKIGAPNQEELAIGAIAEGEKPEFVSDTQAIRRMGIPRDYIDAAVSAASEEIARRRRVYIGDRPPVELAGRSAIVVDDGIATGATMLAALRATRRRNPARLVLAVPVAPRSTLRRLRREVDEVAVLESPAEFFSVGQFYRAFPQLADAEVTELLDPRARASFAPGP